MNIWRVFRMSDSAPWVMRKSMMPAFSNGAAILLTSFKWPLWTGARVDDDQNVVGAYPE
jgi:hypothetical protein